MGKNLRKDEADLYYGKRMWALKAKKAFEKRDKGNEYVLTITKEPFRLGQFHYHLKIRLRSGKKKK